MDDFDLSFAICSTSSSGVLLCFERGDLGGENRPPICHPRDVGATILPVRPLLQFGQTSRRTLGGRVVRHTTGEFTVDQLLEQVLVRDRPGPVRQLQQTIRSVLLLVERPVDLASAFVVLLA